MADNKEVILEGIELSDDEEISEELLEEMSYGCDIGDELDPEEEVEE